MTLLITSAAADAQATISAIVQPSQLTYVLGQRIEFTITAFNDSDQDVTLHFPSSFQAQIWLDDQPFTSEAGTAMFTQRTISAHGSTDWHFEFPSGPGPLGIGVHEVAGRRAQGYGVTEPISFEVIHPDPVVDDVFIDFETYPDGSSTRDSYGTRGLWEYAYAQWGVRWNTTGVPCFPVDCLAINLAEGSTPENTILHTTHSQKNVRAEFDMPVFEVSALVGSAQGRFVTMTIFDQQGNSLDSISSPIVTDYPEQQDSLSLVSDVPIAYVEWVTSDPYASTIIDDLYLDVRAVPEPGGAALVAASLVLLVHRRRSRKRSRS